MSNKRFEGVEAGATQWWPKIPLLTTSNLLLRTSTYAGHPQMGVGQAFNFPPLLLNR